MDDYVYPGERFTQSGMKSGHGMGMTLRDWFAGQVAVGLYSGLGKDINLGQNHLKADAEAIYKVADALLAARSAK